MIKFIGIYGFKQSRLSNKGKNQFPFHPFINKILSLILRFSPQLKKKLGGDVNIPTVNAQK